MKRLFFSVLSVVSLSLLNAQTQNDKGLFIDSEGELFSGTVTNTQDNMKVTLSVSQGLVSGPAEYFYSSGKLMESGELVNGVKNQKWTRYNENGTVSAIAFYNMGKKSGTWLVYDDKGNKRFEMNYNDGAKSGIWITWDENGTIADSKDYSRVN